jgi:hypothetical protein
VIPLTTDQILARLPPRDFPPVPAAPTAESSRTAVSTAVNSDSLENLIAALPVRTETLIASSNASRHTPNYAQVAKAPEPPAPQAPQPKQPNTLTQARAAGT